MSSPLQLVLEPRLGGVPADDDLAKLDGLALVRLLRDEGFEPVRPESAPGAKGGEVLVPIIEIVVSGGGIAGLVKLVDSWIKNRGGRSITIRTADNRRLIDITGKNLGESGIIEVVRALTGSEDLNAVPIESSGTDAEATEPGRDDRIG